jgi:hypothetical protein
VVAARKVVEAVPAAVVGSLRREYLKSKEGA